jgi:hypothetical protein
VLMYILFSKIFPIISIWELMPETHPAPAAPRPTGSLARPAEGAMS